MIPLIRPRPPRLSEARDRLREIEDSGIFSNFGPANTKFEQDLIRTMFGGIGACMTVCNATIGLMLAIKNATGSDASGKTSAATSKKYALMPSFTFAAAAQAAIWCGFTPLFCDIDPGNWAADAGAEDEMLEKYRGEIAVVVPYATFGYDIDLAHYERLSAVHGIPVVVDAAASLGTSSASGHGFGTGFSGAVAFSMHATKSFSTGEGGLIYSADHDLIGRLRAMANFGFGQPRSATMPGLNAKLSEVGALLAHLRLDNYQEIIQARAALVGQYRAKLPELTFQGDTLRQQAHQFAPALLPSWSSAYRNEIQARLKDAGIGMATYFSPHLMEQPYIAANSEAGDLRVTEDVAARMISLPLYDEMTVAEVNEVAAGVNDALRAVGRKAMKVVRASALVDTAEDDGVFDEPAHSAWQRLPVESGSAPRVGLRERA